MSPKFEGTDSLPIISPKRFMEKEPWIKIFFFLDEKGKVKTSDFRELSGSYEKIRNTANRLGNSGLLEIEKDGNTTYYELSEKGEKVLQKLEEILKIFSEFGTDVKKYEVVLRTKDEDEGFVSFPSKNDD